MNTLSRLLGCVMLVMTIPIVLVTKAAAPSSPASGGSKASTYPWQEVPAPLKALITPEETLTKLQQDTFTVSLVERVTYGIDVLKKEIARLRERLASTEKLKTECAASQEAHIDACSKEKAALEEANRVLQQANANNDSERAALATTNQELMRQKTELEEGLARCNEEKTKIVEQAEANLKKIGQLTAENQDLSYKNDALFERANSLAQDASKAQAAEAVVRDIMGEKQAMQEELVQCKIALEDAQKLHAEKDACMRALVAQLKVCQDAIRAMEQEALAVAEPIEAPAVTPDQPGAPAAPPL